MVRSLAERVRAHEQQKARLAEQEAKLKGAERRAHTRGLIEAGGLVDKAGLLELEPNALPRLVAWGRDPFADAATAQATLAPYDVGPLDRERFAQWRAAWPPASPAPWRRFGQAGGAHGPGAGRPRRRQPTARTRPSAASSSARPTASIRTVWPAAPSIRQSGATAAQRRTR
jgi:hypothetical protein